MGDKSLRRLLGIKRYQPPVPTARASRCRAGTFKGWASPERDMDVSDALKWSVYERVVASISFVVGMGIAAGSIWYGLGSAVVSNPLLLLDPGNMQSPAIVGIGIIVGILVWQLGKTTARHHAMVGSTEQEITDEVNTERLKSEVLSALDGRLSDMEDDLETMRRQAARLEQQEREDKFAFEDTESSAGASNGTTTQDTGTSEAEATGELPANGDKSGTADDGSQE